MQHPQCLPQICFTLLYNFQSYHDFIKAISKAFQVKHDKLLACYLTCVPFPPYTLISLFIFRLVVGVIV